MRIAKNIALSAILIKKTNSYYKKKVKKYLSLQTASMCKLPQYILNKTLNSLFLK